MVENQSGHVVRSWTPLTLCCTHCAPQAFHHCVRDHCHPEHWDRGGIPRESEKENMQQETDEQTVLTVHMTHLVNNRQKQNKNKVIGCWLRWSHGGRGDRLHGPPGRELSPRTSAESSVDAKSKVRACMNMSICSDVLDGQSLVAFVQSDNPNRQPERWLQSCGVLPPLSRPSHPEKEVFDGSGQHTCNSLFVRRAVLPR